MQVDGSYIPHYTTTELLGPLRQIRQIFPSNPSNPSKSQSSPGPSVKSVKTMELLGPLRQIRQIRQNHGAPRAPTSTTPLCLWSNSDSDSIGLWTMATMIYVCPPSCLLQSMYNESTPRPGDHSPRIKVPDADAT